ncbi:MAG: rhamnogalacturonan acetylesterase [Asticcacaulis sp.]
MRKLIISTIAVLSLWAPNLYAAEIRQFNFAQKAKPDFVSVGAAAYSSEKGFGFEGIAPTQTKRAAEGKPFYFSTDVPPGNYKVTVTLGGEKASETTVKAELRRLMLERVQVPAKRSVTKSFIVNVRTPEIAGGGKVQLNARETGKEVWAWDSRLTLEFVGNPAVQSIRIEPVDVPTVYLLGDSTVTDQSGEPFASWGQMLPRFFKPTVAVANHGQSGESTFSSKSARRFDKIISEMKPGDYFIVQFGHNDAKSKDEDKLQKYRDNLIDWANQVKAKGGTAVIVTPVHRNRFEGGKVRDTHGQFPQMAREAAEQSGAYLIDLHAQSAVLYEALGAKEARALFMHTPDYAKMDGTHHSPYGAYELAKIVVQGLRDVKAPIAAEVIEDLPAYDPAQPTQEKDFKVPPSLSLTSETPLGN